MMKAVSISEIFIGFRETTMRIIPEGCLICNYRTENLKSHKLTPYLPKFKILK
jgi:hypothetical protein